MMSPMAGDLESIDEMLREAWDNYKLSPKYIFMSCDEYRNLAAKHGTIYTDEEWLQFLAENADGDGVIRLGE